MAQPESVTEHVTKRLNDMATRHDTLQRQLAETEAQLKARLLRLGSLEAEIAEKQRFHDEILASITSLKDRVEKASGRG